MNRDMTARESQQDEIEAAAAAWVIRAEGEAFSPGDRRALDRWLGAHPAHRPAFEAARATWAELGGLRAAPGALAADGPKAGDLVADGVSSRVRRAGRWSHAGALAACLLLVVALGVLWVGDPLTALTADYRTAPGESRTVTLPDGSTVDLGPASAVAVRFDDRERRLALLSGAVYVVTAPMKDLEGRPFVVEAAGGTARALGTQFAVARLPGAVQVAVAEHQVEVALAGGGGDNGAGGEAVVLSAGQAVHYSAEGGLARPRDIGAGQVAPWRRGRLIFDDVPFAEAAAELGRYRRGRIVIAARLADRRVSGVFETARLDDALALMARELGAGVTAVPFITWIH